MSDESQEHYLAGLKHFGEDNYPEAIAAYKRALEVKPDWTDAMHGLAMAHANGGELDEAIRIGNRIVELDGEDPFAHTSLSMFYQRKSAIAEAAGDAEEARAMIDAAEKEGAKARMLSWKQELKANPNAVPPGPAGSMDVIQ
ncbi:MAG: tetratricopeptide repeat protein [bacterium]|nr:tetratricopeptide repeat protein [bacterium]